jgi:hypothetical protein
MLDRIWISMVTFSMTAELASRDIITILGYRYIYNHYSPNNQGLPKHDHHHHFKCCETDTCSS